MKKYGEIFINEPNTDGTVSWLARWYEGNKLIETKEGTEKDYATAQTKSSAWLKSKGDK